MWGRAASPRPVGLGVWPRGHRLRLDAPDALEVGVWVFGPEMVSLGRAARTRLGSLPMGISTIHCTVIILDGWMLLLEVVLGLTQLIFLLWPHIPLLCLGTQAFLFQLVNFKLIPVGLA